MKTNPNEPISPFTELDEQGRPFQFYSGLTKREHFAGLVMQGLLACNATYGGSTTQYSMLAHDALKHADALIQELNKES